MTSTDNKVLRPTNDGPRAATVKTNMPAATYQVASRSCDAGDLTLLTRVLSSDQPAPRISPTPHQPDTASARHPPHDVDRQTCRAEVVVEVDQPAVADSDDHQIRHYRARCGVEVRRRRLADSGGPHGDIRRARRCNRGHVQHNGRDATGRHATTPKDLKWVRFAGRHRRRVPAQR